jgi:Contractile injection system tube protein
MKKKKARLVPLDGSGGLDFRFNPKEYSVAKSATWERPTNKGAKHSTAPEFIGSNPRTVQMELLFDDWEGDGNLVQDIEILMKWMEPTDKSLGDGKPRPRLLQFHWDKNHSLDTFLGFIKSAAVKYTMFDSQGVPVRATVNLSMEEVAHDPKKTNPTSGSPLDRRSHVVAAGDSLQSLAYREYDDPTLWRGLAIFNRIDNPLRVLPGTRLLIPTADEAAALS